VFQLLGCRKSAAGDSVLQKVKADAQMWFNAIKQKSTADGIRLKTDLVISPTEIQDAIVSYADRENVDLIVIGGGKSGLKERLPPLMQLRLKVPY
jgi:nucleotide-binding universal stress UspA family protein